MTAKWLKYGTFDCRCAAGYRRRAQAGGQITFAEALASAEAQCQQQRAAYVAAMSPEQMEAIQRNAAKPRRAGHRNTIERERGDVVSRSQCPYVGVTGLIKGAR